MIRYTLLFCIITSSNLSAEYYFSHQKRIGLTAIDTHKSRELKSTDKLFFKDTHNNIIAITNQIIVSYKKLSDKEKIEKNYQLTYIKNLDHNIFLYKVPNKKQTFEISNTLYKLESIKYAHPNFIKEKRKRTNDPLFTSTWHLKNSGNNTYREDLIAGADIHVEAAWNITKGAGTKVAITDDAIDIYHEDFVGSVAGFNNFKDAGSTDPTPSSSAGEENGDWHGTSCAGLIIARENSKGSVGVAPDADFYAVKYGIDTASDITMFNWLKDQGADVISNSWGTYHISDALEQTFENLALHGRDGKGTIILFASGNENLNLDSNDIDDESESPNVLGIGATSGEDTVTSYSNYGSSLDFVAPGGEYSTIVTTDVSGDKGYNNGNYHEEFRGTSAAAPIVAGVITLMLSTNPNLTRLDVIQILKNSADKVGGDIYDAQGHNNHYGYGRINAENAVSQAEYLSNTTLYPPTKLTFTNVTQHAVTLHWKDNAKVEKGFKVYRDGNLIHKTAENITSYTDTNLNKHTTYTYTVKATDEE